MKKAQTSTGLSIRSNLRVGENEMLVRRINELKEQYAEGQRRLTELGNNQRELEKTMLRINGAIEVLEQMLAQG